MPDAYFATGVVARLALRASADSRPVVLIDGASGSGKSSLGGQLAAMLGAQLLHLEDMYPGWDGLEAASSELYREVLSSPSPRWRGWDWPRGVHTHWRSLDATQPLVVEGSGALSRQNRLLATFGIWLELDEATRKRRALDRDGDRYAPHWERWALQEREFLRRERPVELADAIVDVASGDLRMSTA